jgi:hypothetical protein
VASNALTDMVNLTRADLGRIAEGYFVIDGAPNGYINVTDLAGEFVGGRKLNPGDDPAAVAGQILRGKHKSFNRWLNYPSLGIA